MAIKITMYVIKANVTVCCISFWVPSFVRTLALLYLLSNFSVICWQLVSRCPSSIGIGFDSPQKYYPIPNTTQYWKILGNTQYPNASIVLTLEIRHAIMILLFYGTLDIVHAATINVSILFSHRTTHRQTFRMADRNFWIEALGSTDAVGYLGW